MTIEEEEELEIVEFSDPSNEELVREPVEIANGSDFTDDSRARVLVNLPIDIVVCLIEGLNASSFLY